MTKEQFSLVTNTGDRLVTNAGEPIGVTMEAMQEAVQVLETIPDSAKKAVKDVIKEWFNRLQECNFDLGSIEWPSKLLEKIPALMEYLQSVISYFG